MRSRQWGLPGRQGKTHVRTTITGLAGGLLLLVAALLPARAAPATQADPAVWGVYAKLLGHTWEAPGKGTVTVNWAVPGEVITETWVSPTTTGTVTVTRGAQAGELVVKSSPIPMKWTGHIVDADTVVFARALPPRMAYRITYGAGAFELQRVKVEGSAVVAVTSSERYTSPDAPPVVPVPQPTQAAVASAGKGGKKGARGGAKKAPVQENAPVGPHPVRVVGGTEVIASTFKDGVSGIDASGARYDCYLIDTRPGDRWEVQVEADDSSVPNLVSGQFRSVDAADCGASRELALPKRRESWLWVSTKQTHAMTAGGGYYWFLATGLPERSYALRFKRKEGKVDGAAAGVAQLPAPLVASDRGPVTPVLEDPARRKQRMAGVEAVYARLAGRTYQGNASWQPESGQMVIPYKQYRWGGKGGELQIQNGQVLTTGVQADGKQYGYRLDPMARLFRATDGDAYIEHLPTDDGGLRINAYGRDGAGRRLRTSSTVMTLLPDGSQAFGGTAQYAPTTPAKLAALVPVVQQKQAEMRVAMAEQRRLEAEQRRREAEQDSGGGVFGRALGGALMGAMLGGGGQNSIDLAVTGAQAAAQGGNAYQVLNSMGQVAAAKEVESERQLNEAIAAAQRQAAEQEAVKQKAARAEAEAQAQENARRVAEAEAAARQQAMDADAQRVAEAARVEREAADAAKREREARLAREKLEADRLKQQAEDERKRREAEAIAAREKAQAEAKARADQARRQNETNLMGEFRGRAATCAGGGKDILYLQTSWPSKQGCNVQFEARCPGVGPGLGVRFGQTHYVGGSCMGIGDAIRIGPMPCQAEQVEIRMTGASCPG